MDLQRIKNLEAQTALRIYTLGDFKVYLNDTLISTKDWGRDKTIQLFQFFITSRNRHGLHKEKIYNRIWDDVDDHNGDRDFKVALHGINKILEPHRESRSETKYIVRQGLSYQLNSSEIWIDNQVMESAIAIANESLTTNISTAKEAYKYALNLYNGSYLPERIYMDWTSVERERLQLLALSAYMTLAQIELDEQPYECMRLCQAALQIDYTWEEAYTLLIKAYIATGNRPQAIKTFNICKKILDEEFGLEPLPETRKLIAQLTD